MTDFDSTSRDPDEIRSRLAAIVTSSDDAIISKTLDGVIVTWNEAATRIFGYTAAEAIGHPINILIPPERLDEEPAILARLRRGDRVDHYETVRLRKDGTRVDISLTISPIRNSAGEIVGASKIARDITQQKRAAEALRVSNERFRLMANATPVLMWIADSSKSRTWFNKGWLEFTGRAAEEELGFGWTQNVHEDDLARCLERYAEGFDTRQPFRSEYRIKRHDGEARWLLEQASPLFEGAESAFSGYIGSCVDITESKHLQAEREVALRAERAAREDAERVGRLKDEFLATVSHELRTPLNAILGWSTLLRRMPPGSEDHGRGLETIERNARLQAQIIADLLDMSRIISGKVQLDIQPVDLQEVITAAIDAVKPSIEARKLRLRVTLDARAGRLRGDPGRLQQVFWNLLTNAVKFTPPGGRIDVVLERVNSHVERPSFSDVDVTSIELPSLAGVRAVVVDDEQDARVLICRLIEEQGGRCSLAASGADALEILAAEDVNILISDIGMPDLDGYELIRNIRAMPASSARNIPAIALTAYARADDRQRALLAGYQMHVAKPVDPRELIAGIASLLNIGTRPGD